MQMRHFIVTFPHMLIMYSGHIYHLLPAGGGCGGPARWAAAGGCTFRGDSGQRAISSRLRSQPPPPRLPTLPGCRGQELPPSPRSGRHCPQGPPPRLLLLPPPLPPPRTAAGPRTRVPRTRCRPGSMVTWAPCALGGHSLQGFPAWLRKG
jgi:hypothetical protein